MKHDTGSVSFDMGSFAFDGTTSSIWETLFCIFWCQIPLFQRNDDDDDDDDGRCDDDKYDQT